MKKLFFVLFGGAVALASCNGKNAGSEVSEPDGRVGGNATDTIEAQIEASLEQVWATEKVLETPESVYYYPEGDVLYVSNIAGKPSEKDGKGYISKLSLDGNIIEKEWVKGIDAPKGMAVLNGKLYVTNIDELVEIDINSAKISNRYKVEGASFLNDVAVSPDNKIIFSDSDKGKIHVLENGKVQVWAEPGVERPNGLITNNGKVYLASNGKLQEVTQNGKVGETLAEGIGAGDGVVAVDENTFLVSNWNGEIFYVLGPGEQMMKKVLDTKDQNINSADIEYVKARNLLLVPTFGDNRVVAYKLNRGNLEN